MKYNIHAEIEECVDNEINFYLTEYEFFCPAEPILRLRDKIYPKFIVSAKNKLCQKGDNNDERQ